jgi:hypothetical protein
LDGTAIIRSESGVDSVGLGVCSAMSFHLGFRVLFSVLDLAA